MGIRSIRSDLAKLVGVLVRRCVAWNEDPNNGIVQTCRRPSAHSSKAPAASAPPCWGRFFFYLELTVGLPSSAIVSGSPSGTMKRRMANLARPRPAQRWGRFLSAMRHRDIEYTVVQGIGGQLWKWAVSFESIDLRGQGATKSEAIAERARDRPGAGS